MSDESKDTMMAEVITLPEGDIMALEDGTIQFRFRSMEYIAHRGRDSTEFMGITLGKESSDAVKRFFRKVHGY